MQFGHVVGAAPDLRGHVEHPTATHGGQLCAVADERDRCPGLSSHREEGAGGVLVEHPGFVNDHPITPRQQRMLRRAVVGTPGVGVEVTDREACPYAVSVPPPSVRVDERCDAGCGYAEFFLSHLCGFLRRRNHPRRPTVLGGNVDGRAQHGRFPAARCSLHDHQRIGRSDSGCREGLPFIESSGVRCLGHVRVFRRTARSCGGELVA